MHGVGNIDFRHLGEIGDVARLGGFDMLYSRIVLQHNPPPVMKRLLTDLLAQLRPGGVALFQLPTYREGYRFHIDDYLNQHNATEMEMHYFPQAALLELITNQGCRLLEVREDDAIGTAIRAISNTLLIQKPQTN